MMKSLYSGVAGLKTHTQRMDVIGNNISNVNTTAFKASAVTFKDIFYQNKSRASSGNAISGGTNANQVGYGAALSSISHVMTQSGMTYSDKETDCAIYGDGFFQVMDAAGNIYYTRAGVFHIDNYGNLCDPNGYIVLGVSGDPTGIDASSQRINLYVPPVDNNNASVTKTFNIDGEGYTYTVSAGTFGEEGNLTIQFVNGPVPFATQNGSTITVTMDLTQDFGRTNAGTNPPQYSATQASQDFADAVYNAIMAGGVTLSDGILPLEFDFVSLPNELGALQASNKMVYEGTYTYEDDNGDVQTINGSIAGLTFTVNNAGDFGNSYEINLQANSKAEKVSARWSENVLIITIPEKAVTLKEIQDAVTEAAGANPNKNITVTGIVAGGTAAAGDGDTVIDANTARVIRGNGLNIRLGMTGGKDNFFKTFAESLGSITLTGGRTAALQTTEDLEEIFIDDDGVIYGVHAVHGTIALGRIDLAMFENPEGLNQAGTSYYTVSLSSGEAQVRLANSAGVGSVVSGALEMSNADLAQEISDMIITQRGYQANTRVITVTDSMLEELVNLKR